MAETTRDLQKSEQQTSNGKGLPARTDNPARQDKPVVELPEADMSVTRLAQPDIDLPVYQIRGQKVMLEQDVAQLYEVETATLLRSVRRNIQDFPTDFLFRLSEQEYDALQKEAPGEGDQVHRNKSTPYAFTEMGVAMVSQVLNSARAHQINVSIIRDFVKLRKLCGSHIDLADKLDAIDAKYDKHFQKLFLAIQSLQNDKQSDRQVGFYVR